MINASIRLTTSAVVLGDTSAGVTDRLMWPLLKGVKLALPTPQWQKKEDQTVQQDEEKGTMTGIWNVLNGRCGWMGQEETEGQIDQEASREADSEKTEEESMGGGCHLSSSTYTHRVTLQQWEGESKFMLIISFNNNVMSLLTCL